MSDPTVSLPPGARICVVLLTGVGDVVHGLPLVNALKRHDPSCRITWVAEPVPAGIVEHHPAVDEVVVFRKKDGARGVMGLARSLRGRRFDVTLNLNIYFKSIFPTVLSRAPVRVGFDRGRARDGVWLFANRPLPERSRAHTQDMFLEFLALMGVEPRPLEWHLGPTPEEAAERDRFFQRFSRPVVAVVPASANAKKDWPAERYGPVLDALESDLGVDTMIVGGPSVRERALTDRILASTRAEPEVALVDGIRRVLWLLSGSHLVIAPDTGPVHMARAMDVPVVGLYGHTNPWRVGPYRRYQDLWVDAYTEPGEAPDPSNATPKLDRMERITPEQVLDRVRRVLS
ncbi:MAG TPA: glycosyltransferase family 9 protein [Longimicrobiales bacterium]|nr:glycosyltransferase family 9 protein [Longimicrobiales bacterium]